MQRRNSQHAATVLHIMSRYPVIAGLAVLLATVSVEAQTPPPQSTVPQAKEPGAAAGTLSEQLSRSGGVIRPPTEVDRKIEATPPNPGASTMPVIPPPGTPGGDPDVKPK